MAKRGRRKKSRQNKVDLTVVTMIVISILLMFLIYSQSGSLGSTLSPILRWNNGVDKIFASNWNICNSNIHSL